MSHIRQPSERIEIERTLKRAEVFLGLTDIEIKQIAALPSSREMTCQSGQFLFKKGEEAKNIFILEDGEVNILVEIEESSAGKPNQITVDLVKKGSLMGWPALVRPHLYVLSGVCNEPSKLAVISGAELLSLFETNPIIGYKVYQGLSQVIGSRFIDLHQILMTGKRWPFIEKLSGT